jgi:hypothetical protein
MWNLVEDPAKVESDHIEVQTLINPVSYHGIASKEIGYRRTLVQKAMLTPRQWRTGC